MYMRSKEQIEQINATLAEALRIIKHTTGEERVKKLGEQHSLLLRQTNKAASLPKSHANAPLKEISILAEQFLKDVKIQAIQAYREQLKERLKSPVIRTPELATEIKTFKEGRLQARGFQKIVEDRKAQQTEDKIEQEPESPRGPGKD